MDSVAHLSYCGFNYSGAGDWSRKSMEADLQRRNQGLRPSIDYLFQPMQTGWQVSGITPIGARAVCVLAQAHKIIPNRLDVTLTVTNLAVKEGTDFNSTVHRLIAWFKVNKPKINISELLPITGDRRILFGSKNSRWCLWVSERMFIAPDQQWSENLEITWTMRNENCKAAWEFFVTCGSDADFEHYSREAFAACTNTILGSDFFGLGLSDMPYLRKEKPGSEQKDWHAYLHSVAKKIMQHYLNDPEASYDKDIKWLNQEVNALLDKQEQQVV